MTKVDLVTGFLGAGKTTFIHRYIRYLRDRGETFAIIENEFGKAGVDAATFAGDEVEVREISGGCICCTLKVGFHDLLESLAGRYDRIIVEPSGVFNCDDFLDVLYSPSLRRAVTGGMAVAVVDPGRLARMSGQDLEVLASEIIPVGAVLLSKAQMYTPQALEEAKAAIARLLCGRVEGLSEAEARRFIRDTTWDELDEGEFADLQGRTLVPRAHERWLVDHAALFQSMQLEPKGPFGEEPLRGILARALSGDWGDILRIKGVVPGEGRRLLVNCTPDSITVAPVGRESEPVRGLNIIGRGLRRREITGLFAQGA